MISIVVEPIDAKVSDSVKRYQQNQPQGFLGNRVWLFNHALFLSIKVPMNITEDA
jgi:hypothetical protein